MIERDESIASSDSDTLHWILRISVAACFIGHGAFGLITKAAWLGYFAIFGIPEAWAWKLMPVVGVVDVSVGVLTLIQPVRAVILYMTFWGFQTACLRPLTGQGVWELLERAGNYGVPLAFLCLLGAGRSPADWFSFRPGPPLPSSEPQPSAGFSVRQRRSCSSAMAASTSRWGRTGPATARPSASARPPWRRIRSAPWPGGSSAYWVSHPTSSAASGPARTTHDGRAPAP
jgi:hypothetical protein